MASNPSQEDEFRDSANSTSYSGISFVTTTDSSEDPKLVSCPHCDKSYKKRGIKRHITSAHPDIHRQNLVDALNTSILLTYRDEDDDPEVLTLCSEFDELIKKLDNLISSDAINHECFELLCKEYIGILRKCANELPGPKNPATKFYELRKKSAGFMNTDAGYNSSSNPQRMSKRKRKARKQAYQESMVQYLFYNQRKKAVRTVMNSNDKSCHIPLAALEDAFTARWSCPNDAIGPIYNHVSSIQQNEIDADFISICSFDTVRQHIKKMNIDSAPGPDGILVRWVKSTLKKSKIVIANLLTYMIKHNFVPFFMHEARTILIYKGGDDKDPKNWRPITVSSVIRRIIEKILDKELRRYISLNEHQRGFTNQAGTLINTTLVHECLQKAKREKGDCTIIFCDISQAFDNVGHAHIFNQISSKPAPTLLKQLSCSLASHNFTRINTVEGKTGVIRFKRGVMQGSPLSPFLFNVSIDPMVQELSEKEVADKFGFRLHPQHPHVSNAEFADDTGLIANSRQAAIELYQQSSSSLDQIGLQMSPPKSVAISIVSGELCKDSLKVDDNVSIRCIGSEETIKYLGVNFNDCIVFDEGKCAKKFNDQIEKLVSKPMLRPDQKLKVLKDYIWPTLVYPFQNAPLTKLSTKFLDSIDQIIRTSAKQILNLPTSTPTNMLYSSTKVKGLGLIRAKWEAGIQNFNATEILIQSKHALLYEIKDFESDQAKSLDFLVIPPDIRETIFSVRGKKSKPIRDYLRSLEYDQWCKLPQKGQGVIQFAECPQANKWIHSKNGLSSSEWTNALKMIGNVMPINAIPRPDQGTFRCRHGCSETETLGHILGKCPRGELIRNNRHHAVRNLIADAMKKSGWKVLQEVECTGDGSRRVDIIAYNQSSRKGFILDPTIRMEQNDTQQAEAVNKEKKEIYDPCIPYFCQKLGLDDIEVVGLYVGARGTITKFFLDFMKSQALTAFLIEDIVTTVLKKSVQICQHHLFSTVSNA